MKSFTSSHLYFNFQLSQYHLNYHKDYFTEGKYHFLKWKNLWSLLVLYEYFPFPLRKNFLNEGIFYSKKHRNSSNYSWSSYYFQIFLEAIIAKCFSLKLLWEFSYEILHILEILKDFKILDFKEDYSIGKGVTTVKSFNYCPIQDCFHWKQMNFSFKRGINNLTKQDFVKGKVFYLIY